jgi:Tol biopolymer transport system component
MGWLEKLLGVGSASDGNVVIHEVSLGALLPGALRLTLVASPDGRRFAYAVRRGCRWFVVADGKPSPKEYDLTIPLDPPREFAEVGPQTQEALLSVLENDFATQQGFVANVFGRPIFSPDSRRLAYVAYRTVSQQVFQYPPPFHLPVKHFLVIDDSEGEPFDRIVHGSVVFSPNSSRVAYAAERQGKFLIVVDGKVGRPFDDNYNPVFSPDSRHVAYVGGKVGSRSAVVDDEIVSAKYPDVGSGTGVVFSPDGQHLAYAALTAPGTEFVVIDGKEDEPYDNVGKLYFSPDSRRVLYTAWRAGKAFVVIDGVPGKAYDAIGYPEQPFSPDSRRVAYLAARDGKRMVVADGKEEGDYEEIAWLWFSPDSRHVAYRAKRGKKQFAVVDGHKGKPYDLLFAPTFSPDCRRVAYFADDTGKTFVVVDGVEGRAKEYSFCVGQVVFDGPNRLHTLAARTDKRGTELFRVEVEIPEKSADQPGRG